MTVNQPRTPPGIPSGGQFSSSQHGEPDIALYVADDDTHGDEADQAISDAVSEAVAEARDDLMSAALQYLGACRAQVATEAALIAPDARYLTVGDTGQPAAFLDGEGSPVVVTVGPSRMERLTEALANHDATAQHHGHPTLHVASGSNPDGRINLATIS